MEYITSLFSSTLEMNNQLRSLLTEIVPDCVCLLKDFDSFICNKRKLKGGRNFVSDVSSYFDSSCTFFDENEDVSTQELVLSVVNYTVDIIRLLTALGFDECTDGSLFYFLLYCYHLFYKKKC
jgi:hypothetical protein